MNGTLGDKGNRQFRELIRFINRRLQAHRVVRAVATGNENLGNPSSQFDFTSTTYE